MQTFLPFADFAQSARVLDDKRLRNQQNENLVIARTLLEGGGWAKHPAVKMWTEAVPGLVRYALRIGEEARRRGFKEYHREWFEQRQEVSGALEPWWLGLADFHASHRAALLHKKPDWYSQFGWLERPRLAYVWPGPCKC